MINLLLRTWSQTIQSFLPVIVALVWLRRQDDEVGAGAVRRGLIGGVLLTPLAGLWFQHVARQSQREASLAWTAAGIALTEPLVCEVVMGLGCIPLARYGTPGTAELAQSLEPYVPKYDAILMSNHGVVAYGDTLEHAYMKMETVEHFAQISLVTHMLGRQQPLQEREIEKLLLARTKYFGAKNAASMPLPLTRVPEEVS